MLFNFKYSILDSYKASLKVNYKNILFYASWYGIIFFLGTIVMFGLGIYLDILNISNMTQSYAWIVTYFKQFLKSFFMGMKYSDIKFTGFSFYDFLKLFVPESFLNSALQTISFKEYFNTILLPKKIVLVPFLMLYCSFAMTISIGYIKTALEFQSNKKATLYDMYQYIYLLPQYLFGKVIMFLLCSIILVLSFFVDYLIVVSSPLVDQHSLKGIITIGIMLGVILLGLLCLTFLYQRLRFMKYFIIDKEVSAFKAFALSWNATRGSIISLILFSLIATLIRVINPTLGLLVIISIWLNKQAEVSLYRQMIEVKNK